MEVYPILAVPSTPYRITIEIEKNAQSLKLYAIKPRWNPYLRIRFGR
jgi:hypothetical protein